MVVSKLETLLHGSVTVNQAKQIHALILTTGLPHLQASIVRQIIVSPSNSPHFTTQYVRQILLHAHNPDAFSWSFAIRSLSQHGQFREAFDLYVQMQRFGLGPTTYALSSSLKACGRVVFEIGGVSIHAQVHKFGFCEVVYVQTALVDFYSKLGHIEIARKVFDEMVVKNVVSWNSVLSGYLKSGDLAMARTVFDEMPIKDAVSWNSMISGYWRSGNMEVACALFRQMPERNIASWNAMVTGYLDCGKIELARSFFDEMPRRNNISWISMISGYSKCGDVQSARVLFDQMDEKDTLLYSAMIASYAQNGRSKEALLLFNTMLQPNVNIQPDKMTFASVISACSQLGDLEFGSWVESYMHQLGIRMDDHLTTALIDLFAKCGSIDRAYELFRDLQTKDLVSYTAMILGCGLNGRANDAIKLFEEMMDAQISPNLVTFTGILTAYNHFGLVEEGYKCFTSMQKHGLVPSVDHYGIMVDLLGRAGRLKEAYELIKSMPVQPHAGVWGALLLACSLHINVELGEIAAKRCFELEADTTGYQSLLASIYASVGRWDDAKRLRKGTQEKLAGCSWMEQS